MKTRHLLSGLLCVAMAAACTDSRVPSLPEDRLPTGALDALQRHVRNIGGSDLNCERQVLAEAPRVEQDINADGRPDFAIDTRNLRCTSREGNVPDAYFCGIYVCGFPLLVSHETGWELVQLMAGNEIEAFHYYREPRYRVRQVNLSDPSRRTVLVREYAWREARLQQVMERVEEPQRLAGR